MRQGTYLNIILTVNAALLTGLLWGQLAGRASLETQASAQGVPLPAGQSAIPVTSADQRQRQIELMRDIKLAVDDLKKSVMTGTMKVEVSNIDQLKQGK
jgi:hypothetical protein